MVRCSKHGIIIDGKVVAYRNLNRVVFVEKDGMTTVHMFDRATNKQIGYFGYSSSDKTFYNKLTEYLKSNNVSFKNESNTDRYENMPVEGYDKNSILPKPGSLFKKRESIFSKEDFMLVRPNSPIGRLINNLKNSIKNK